MRQVDAALGDWPEANMTVRGDAGRVREVVRFPASAVWNDAAQRAAEVIDGVRQAVAAGSSI